ncbi:MAG: hypothetical protein KGO83_04515 [Paenibacillaceae bacterium]|nr:hypothetical protein [Paenibacillaceae bacterium]
MRKRHCVPIKTVGQGAGSDTISNWSIPIDVWRGALVSFDEEQRTAISDRRGNACNAHYDGQ